MRAVLLGPPVRGEGERAGSAVGRPPGSQGRLPREVGLVRGLCVEENPPGLLRTPPPSMSPGIKRPGPQVTPGQSEGADWVVMQAFTGLLEAGPGGPGCH